MKRHRILEPFSRDHNEGLVAARQLINKADKEALALCLMVWEEGMEDHFREEEELLTDLAPQEMGAQLREEHEEIRRMIGVARQGIATEDDLRSLGKKIEEHIRWEERVLFPTTLANLSMHRLTTSKLRDSSLWVELTDEGRAVLLATK